MPRGDRTGPGGMGPMTGRAAGYCAGYDVPGFANPVGGRGGFGRGMGYGYGFGRGYGRGFGFGRGYGIGYYGEYPTPVQPQVSEKTLIENEIKIIGEQLKALETRLGELSKEKK
ncbi:MAG: DUF5320 family protein [Candidatus Cloacimonetes bacterium]|nr:DUF5320 family protein [Candidatus Cloacimonadota bacterium]